MKTAVLVHGMPSKEEYFDPSLPCPSHCHWFAWLQRQLLVNGVLAQAVEMPTPFEPKYEEWDAVLKQFNINENTMLIGHSLGGGFLVRWLSENKVKTGKVVLVAPWLDPNKELTTGFFDFSIDPELASRSESTTAFISKDDDQEELTSAETIKNEVQGVCIKEFDDKGHFTLDDLKTEEFPELLDALLSR